MSKNSPKKLTDSEAEKRARKMLALLQKLNRQNETAHQAIERFLEIFKEESTKKR